METATQADVTTREAPSLWAGTSPLQLRCDRLLCVGIFVAATCQRCFPLVVAYWWQEQGRQKFYHPLHSQALSIHN